MTTRLPIARSESVFEDYKPALTAAQALTEANRCLFCTDAPCVNACPTHIDVPQFIRKIATGNLEGSARTIFASNILGMSCARVCPVEVLCAGACVYHGKGEEPIAIGKLQRFATDAALERGLRFEQAGATTGRRIALIGGGPASLAAAHRLRVFGHSVTIFEKRSVLGGLNTTGIAPHKLKADTSLHEVEWVLGIGGIDLKLGVEVGRDVTLEALEQDFDAVLIGIGLGTDKRVGVSGEEAAGIYGAVDFIERMKLGDVDVRGVEHCIVIGGGNTALDAVREARTLGITDVRLLYRGTEAGMSGYSHEWEAAKLQGVQGLWQRQPTRFEVADGRVVGVYADRLDASKHPIPGTEHRIDAQLVLVAIGQGTLSASFGKVAGLTFDKGRIVTDADGRTGNAKWFAAGDCANGGKEVVNAVAEGDRAARAIHASLMGAKNA